MIQWFFHGTGTNNVNGKRRSEWRWRTSKVVRISPSANLSLPSFLFYVPVPSRDTSIPPSINTSLSFFLSFSLTRTHTHTHTLFSTSRHYLQTFQTIYHRSCGLRPPTIGDSRVRFCSRSSARISKHLFLFMIVYTFVAINLNLNLKSYGYHRMLDCRRD